MQWRPRKRLGVVPPPCWDGNSAEPEAGYGTQSYGGGSLGLERRQLALAQLCLWENDFKESRREKKVNSFFSLPCLQWCFGKSLVASVPEWSMHIHMGISIFLGHFSCGFNPRFSPDIPTEKPECSELNSRHEPITFPFFLATNSAQKIHSPPLPQNHRILCVGKDSKSDHSCSHRQPSKAGWTSCTRPWTHVR